MNQNNMQCAETGCEQEAIAYDIKTIGLGDSQLGHGDKTENVCIAMRGDVQDAARCTTHLTEEESWPKEGDKLYYITDYGEIQTGFFEKGCGKRSSDFLGIFETDTKAQRKLALVKALCPAERFVPENVDFWIWDEVRAKSTRHDAEDATNVYYIKFCMAIGNCHRTKEEAEAYGKILEEAAKDLLN